MAGGSDIKFFAALIKILEFGLGGGEAFVYALKKGMEKAEPPHWLCCTCYEKGQKSTLQKWGTPVYCPDDMAWDCPNCNHRIVVSKTRTPAAQDFFFRRTT